LRADEMTRQVQEELRKRHLYFGDIDGRFTPEVAAALRRYQERKGFAPTGTPDDTTLRSLTLMPPPPAGHPVSPLPDITVLRSDEALAGHEAGDAAGLSVKKDEETVPAALAASVATPASTPTPTSTSTPEAPAAVRPAQGPDPAAVGAFIERYLQAGQANDPPVELRFYGDRVDYFDDGLVDRRFIEEDVRRFERRWPDRRFSLSGPVDVAPAPGGEPGRFAVHFRYRFTEKSSRYSAAGQADVEYVVAGTRPEDWRIVSLKEQRVRP
jgi:peptidoglycan hydrolase-like protein with peptidoglycan-binding domain